MLPIAIAFLVTVLPQGRVDDPPKDSIEGRWSIVGNHLRGTLDIQVGPDHRVSGNLYDQPIRGMWQPNEKRLEFSRFHEEAEIDHWIGWLKANPEDPNADWILQGEFGTGRASGDANGSPKFSWSGQRMGVDGIFVGSPAPASIVAQFVTGDLSGNSACPILRDSGKTKIAVFGRALNPDMILLLQSLDEVIAADPKLNRSFIFLSHESDPTPSEEEFQNQLAEIQKQATEHSIKHFSLGLMNRIPGLRAKPRLGFFGQGDIVVMVIGPDQHRKIAMVRYVQALSTGNVRPELERIRKEVETTLNDLDHRFPSADETAKRSSAP